MKLIFSSKYVRLALEIEEEPDEDDSDDVAAVVNVGGSFEPYPSFGFQPDEIDESEVMSRLAAPSTQRSKEPA